MTEGNPLQQLTGTFNSGDSTFSDPGPSSTSAGNLTGYPNGCLVFILMSTLGGFSSSSGLRVLGISSTLAHANVGQQTTIPTGGTLLFVGYKNSTYQSCFADLSGGTWAPAFTWFALYNPALI